MKYLLYNALLSLLLVGGQSYSQKIKTDSREVVINYPDSTLKAKITYKTKKYKPENFQVYYWYKSNDIKKNLGGYSGQLLDGKYCVFDLDDNMLTEGFFTMGIKCGVWKKWFPKGGLQKIEEYKNGKKHGTFIHYLPTGSLAEVVHYKYGKLHGKYTEYAADTILSVKKFRKGIEIVPEEKNIKSINESEKPVKEKDTPDVKISKEKKEKDAGMPKEEKHKVSDEEKKVNKNKTKPSDKSEIEEIKKDKDKSAKESKETKKKSKVDPIN